MSEFNNKLKDVSVSSLETAIAKAINELIKDELECSISGITYEFFKGAKFEVHLHANSELFSHKDKRDQGVD